MLNRLEQSFVAKKLCLIVVALCAQFLASIAYSEQTQPVAEGQLRAAIIVGILRYTQWGAPLDSATSIQVCSFGDGDVMPYLQGIANRPVVHGKKITTTDIERTDIDPGECHVLLMSKNSDVSERTILDHPEALLICDRCESQDWKPVIEIKKHKNKIVFEVDLTYAKPRKISFRSALLELAASVRRVK